MTLISGRTFGISRTSVVVAHGALTGLFVTFLVSGTYQAGPVPVVLVCVGIGCNFLLSLKLESQLAEYVYDCGDHLIIRKRGREENIHLSGIANISSRNFEGGPLVTLRLDRSGKPGRIFRFFALQPATFNPFRNQAVEDLTVRITKAKSHRVAQLIDPLDAAR